MKLFQIILRNIGTFLFGVLALSPFSRAHADFSDTSSALHRASIDYVAAKGIVKGYPDGTFRPWNTVNRAEIITILANSQVSLEEIKDKKNCFRDVREEWFAPYVCYAKEKGIVSGYSNGLFRPDQKVKMAEAYVMTMKTLGFATSTEEKSAWYRPYVDLIHNNNIFSKFAFLPSREMTREEMAFLMHQLLLVQEKQKLLLTERNSRSVGCGKNPPQAVPAASTVNGVSRNYITAIPENYEKNTPLKLVFAFHGRTNSNAEVRRYYRVEQAAQGDAIFVYPAGLRSGSGYTWSTPGDFALFDQLVKEFSENYCIDTDEIYVVGHSLGAFFANTLACARGDVIRGVGTVGGGTSMSANCTGPVASMIMHNPKDNLVSFSQGIRARDQLIRQNQCGTSSVPVSPEGLNCKAHQGCGDDAPLTWCEHQEDNAYWDGSYYPHTWPKSAGQEIWKFFESLN